MSALGVALAPCAILLSGSGLVAWTDSGARSARAGLLLRIPLAAGIGLGVWSAGFAAVLFAAGSAPGAFLAKDVVLSAVGAALWLSSRSGRRAGPAPDAAFERPALPLAALALSVTMLAALYFVVRLRIEPDGGFDAWAIWNLRARFLARGGGELAAAFSDAISWSHHDYPLLLPGAVAQAWLLLGGESALVPAAIAALMTFGTIAVAAAGVAASRGPTRGLLAALVLLGTPFLIVLGASRMADVPLAFFVTAASVCIAAAWSPGPEGCRFRWLVLAGIAASLGAWTKNEGVLFTLALATGLAAAPNSGSSGDTRSWRLGSFLAGAAPVLLLLGYFKLRYAPPSDILAWGSLGDALARSLDPRRAASIASAFAAELFRADRWNVFPLVAVAVAVAVGLRFGSARRRDTARRALTVAFALTGCGFFAVYLLTPHDLDWHLRTSALRLFAQCWPALVFHTFLALPPASLPVAQEDAEDAGPAAGGA